MLTRYSFMKSSNTLASDGTYYPDPLTFSTQKFRFTEYGVDYSLIDIDISRFDILISKVYNNQRYKDLILDINNIDYIWNQEIGRTIIFPTKSDLERFIEDFIE